MIESLYKATYKSYMQGRKAWASLAANFAEVTCPENHAEDLRRCIREASDIRAMVLQMSQKPNYEAGFLYDAFEVRDTFSSYGDLMQFWAAWDAGGDDKVGENHEVENDSAASVMEKLTYRQEYPRAYYLFRSARNFVQSFDKLPPLTQAALNQHLNIQVRLLTGQIRYVANRWAFDIR